jgi:hypothetical protein
VPSSSSDAGSGTAVGVWVRTRTWSTTVEVLNWVMPNVRGLLVGADGRRKTPSSAVTETKVNAVETFRPRSPTQLL